ncbi:hypothetical protein IAT38_004054 [Cryptococcus sp. DSM 104549]
MLSSMRLLPLRSAIRPLPRSFSTLPLLKAAPSFSRPGPPPLPAADQAEFEALIKANQTVGTLPNVEAVEEAAAEHPDVRKGPKPEFEGDVNPRTGEQGGPKNDPFVAGDSDWQFGGRVTDF